MLRTSLCPQSSWLSIDVIADIVISLRSEMRAPTPHTAALVCTGAGVVSCSAAAACQPTPPSLPPPSRRRRRRRAWCGGIARTHGRPFAHIAPVLRAVTRMRWLHCDTAGGGARCRRRWAASPTPPLLPLLLLLLLGVCVPTVRAWACRYSAILPNLPHQCECALARMQWQDPTCQQVAPGFPLTNEYFCVYGRPHALGG